MLIYIQRRVVLNEGAFTWLQKDVFFASTKLPTLILEGMNL